VAESKVRNPRAAVAAAARSKAAARIRAAAVEAFAERGYHATSTREIAARLSMSPAAMYPHYRSKEQLLFAISLEGHESALATLVDADPGGDPRDRLRAVVDAFAAWQARHRTVAKVVQYELAALSEDSLREIAWLRSRITRALRDIIDDGQALGVFHLENAGGVTLAIVSLCVDICRWFPSRTFSDPAAIGSLYAELAARMVGEQPRADHQHQPVDAANAADVNRTSSDEIGRVAAGHH
jgi:AcrR family transcriptional regulator